MVANLTLKEQAEIYGKSEREMLKTAIREYDNLVVRRSKNLNTTQLNTRDSVESVLSRFADDAVNSTYGMVWNAVDIPFTITSKTQPDLDLSKLAEALANVLENRKTGFKGSLRHVLKCYLEYGSGWMYVFNDGDGDIVHRTFSVNEVSRSLDIFNRPQVVLLDRGNDAYTLVHATGKYEYYIYHKNTESSNASNEISSGPLPYNPIQELSLTGGYNEKYPVGYGIKAISDLKRYDNIVSALTEASAIELTPSSYISSGVNLQNKATLPDPTQPKLSNQQLVIDAAISDKIFPAGYIPVPVNSTDAWRIFEIASVNIREAFNFINRLMTIKDDAQMTATEAQIRTQADLSQIRDTIEVIFAFLNDIHRAQLFILKDHPDFKEWSDINPNDLSFFHTSIFKKESDAQKILEINQGMDICMKAVQLGAMLGQAGYDGTLDTQKILIEVAKITKLALSSERQASGIEQLIQAFAQQSLN